MYILEQTKNGVEKISNIYRIYLNFVYVITAISLVLTLISSKIGLSSDFMFYYLFSLSCLLSAITVIFMMVISRFIDKYEKIYTEIHLDSDITKTDFYEETYKETNRISHIIFGCCIFLLLFILVNCIINGEPTVLKTTRHCKGIVNWLH